MSLKEDQILINIKAKYQDFLNKQDQDLLKEEIYNVCEKEFRLFPYPTILDTETTELFRSMCVVSQSLTKVDNHIASHRPIIGKFIVFFKRLIWKTIKPQLNMSLSNIEFCMTNLIVSHAKLLAANLENSGNLEKSSK